MNYSEKENVIRVRVTQVQTTTNSRRVEYNKIRDSLVIYMRYIALRQHNKQFNLFLSSNVLLPCVHIGLLAALLFSYRSYVSSVFILFCLNSYGVAAVVTFYEGWNFNSGNYLFTTDTK